MEFSLICVYNNQNQLEQQLLRSLKENQVQCDLVLVDNTQNRFSSAASALNYGAGLAKTDILIFSHQDIYLKLPNEIEQMAKAISELPLGNILGAQGAVAGEYNDVSNLTAGSSYNPAENHRITGLVQCDCVDEAFFGMTKATYQALKFNETLCDGWHFYAAEMCLRTRIRGGRVFISPIQLHHFSWGAIDRSYMNKLVEIADAYHKYFYHIWTTCYKVKANWLSVRLVYLVWEIKRILGKKQGYVLICWSIAICRKQNAEKRVNCGYERNMKPLKRSNPYEPKL